MVELIENESEGEFLIPMFVWIRCRNCYLIITPFIKCKKYKKDRNYWRIRADDFLYNTYTINLDNVACKSCDEQLGKKDSENEANDEDHTFFLIKRRSLEIFHLEPYALHLHH